MVSLNALCHFVCDVRNLSKEDLHYAAKSLLSRFSRSVVLPSDYTNWTTARLVNVIFYLIEFTVNYKIRNVGNIIQTTLKTYMLGIERIFCMEWGCKLRLLSGPVHVLERVSLLLLTIERNIHKGKDCTPGVTTSSRK